MAFTYNLGNEIGQLRLELGDETEAKGVKPDGSNFADAELEYFLAKFTGEEHQIYLAAAYACDVLARQWTRYAGQLSIGSGEYSEAFRQSDAYASRAFELRSQYGGGGPKSLQVGVIINPFQAANP